MRMLKGAQSTRLPASAFEILTEIVRVEQLEADTPSGNLQIEGDENPALSPLSDPAEQTEMSDGLGGEFLGSCLIHGLPTD